MMMMMVYYSILMYSMYYCIIILYINQILIFIVCGVWRGVAWPMAWRGAMARDFYLLIY